MAKRRKKNRKRFWMWGVAVIVAACGGLVAQRALKTNDLLKRELLAKVRPFLDQGTDVRRLDLSLSSIHLKGVTLAPKSRSFSLAIDDLEIGYSLWNVLRFGFQPNKIAHKVVLIHPVFTLNRPSTAAGDTLQHETGDAVKRAVESLGTLRFFSVSRAELRLENGQGQSVVLARNMDGRLISQPADSARLSLVGCLFDSKKPNLLLNGSVDLITGSLIRLSARIEESDLSQEIPLLVPGFIGIRGGRIQAEFELNRRTRTAGRFSLRDGSFWLKKAPFEFAGVGLTGSITDTGLTFQGAVRGFNGSPFSVSGRLSHWAHPVLDVSVSCPQLDLKTFFSHMSPGLGGAASGQARFDLRMSGSPQNPSARGRFGAEKFCAAGLTLRRFDCRFELKDSVLVFEGRNPPETSLGFRLDGKLDMSGENKASHLFAELNGDWMDGVPAWLQKRTEAFDGGLACRFQGALQKLTGTVNGKLFVTPKGGSHTVLIPDLNYKDKRFSISLRSDRAFRVEGEVLSPFRHDARWNATVRGCEWLMAFLPEGGLNRKAEGLELSLFMNGNAGEWTFEANGVRPGREFPRALQAVLVSKTRRENRREYDFKATVFGPEGDALPFEARMVSTSDGFIIQQGEIGKWIFMQGQFPRQANEPVKAELRLEDLDLSKLHPTFPELRPFFARITGRLQVSGTKSKSMAHMELAMHKGKFHDVEGFEGEATCDWIGKVFHSGRLDIRKNRLPLLVGEFLPIRGDSVIGKIQSGNLQFGELTKAWTGRKNVLNGEGAFNFNIAGSGLEPIVTGSVHVRNGSIGNISFSEFNAEVTDTLQDPTGPAGGTCLIRNGIFIRDDGLHVEFWGLIPHGGERSADVSVSARGNLIGFLSETNDFIKKSRGTGEVFLRFGGRPGNWKPSSGWIRLEKGELELASIVKKIEKIEGEGRLIEDSPFLQLSRFSAQADGGRLTVSNGRIPGVQPLVFPKWGIDLGVVFLSSPGKGIPVHLPGLMEAGEEGWVAPTGLLKGDSFWITGPSSSPGCVGSLILYDSRLTYPFLETGGSSNKMTFLNRIRWNLRVAPKKDVHYVRQIESPFGNVFLDLQLQDGNGELRFEGAIYDNTFTVWGNLVSTEGNVEVLDRYFKPERITFDFPKGASPILSGRAFTTLTDSTGFASTVWMNLVTDDRITGKEEVGGALGQVHFRFSTDNPNLGRTEADLLAALGYSDQNIKDRAYDAMGMQVDNYFFRPIFGPIERGIRRYLGLDMVRFSSMFGRNIIQLREVQPSLSDPWWLLRSSKVTVGKYLAPGLVLTYSGEIQNQFGYWLPNDGVGLRHSLSLEYSIRPDLFLEMEYFYDNRLLLQRREDKRIWLRHVFPF